MKLTQFVILIVFTIPFKIFAQHNIDLNTNTSYSSGGLTFGIESIYNYNFGKEKTYIGLGGGLGVNFFDYNEFEAFPQTLSTSNGTQLASPVKFNIETPIIANFTIGNKIIRYYLNGSFGIIIHDPLGNDIEKNIKEYSYSIYNRSFESGLKFLIPTKKNSILIFTGYKLNSIKFGTSENLSQNMYLDKINYHSVKIGLGINFGGVFNQKNTNPTTKTTTKP
jgi:hypothetical protein